MKQIALNYLREMTGNVNATFHIDQWESIEELVVQKDKLLVVQKTGWGKSGVYFISTKILRSQGAGLSIIISPLISLMRNQIESAKKLGLNVVTINSSLSTGEQAENERQLLAGNADAVIISPEQLANDKFVGNVLQNLLSQVGLFVVDEAHCISDWGHDFRPDYRRIVRILQYMPSNMPVLATTATANNRVVDDIKQQLGGQLKIRRGSLLREALQLQNIELPNKTERLTWLAQALLMIEGTGIIYAKTTKDCDTVAQWLQSKGFDARAYYGSVNSDERKQLEDDLIHNRLKALVATSALGMGFDKPDISFVIHYQAPGNVIEYYQQVGRAGRGIDHAIGILMFGHEDERIQSFFINNAFPSETDVNELLELLGNHDGLKKSEIEKFANLSSGNIEKILKFLSVESPSPILKDGQKYYRTAIDYQLPYERIERLSSIKVKEWNTLKEYHRYETCLMHFLANELDDDSSEDCGKCANCAPKNKLNISIGRDLVLEANEYLKHLYIKVEPRKIFGGSGDLAREAFPIYGFSYKDKNLQAEQGFALSKWRDGVWGSLVAEGKKNNHFSDDLLDPMVKMIESMPLENQPKWLTYVPSPRHHFLVKDFAHKLAAKLKIHCSDCVFVANEKPQQKMMSNSFHQSHNLDGAFDVQVDQVYGDSVFLLDDAVDSKWTFTVIAALLRQKGAGAVIPIALTSTSNNG
ncbi:MAG: RecQ family ATP-dependent DNA helicase [Methylobacter sp.]|uniref:DNA 3'-5' helicase n=1 Tax=Candidatus Methylobacter titanis TaxID=3053457 RepID=A0AA43TKC8_9GAMM|nr:RecQ family ATP-dependent DNA helicase [Candidatus Methylobacter titanis]